MTRSSIVPAVILGAAAVIGCTSSAQPSVFSERSDSAGITIVRSLAPRWAPGEEWTISDAPKLTIGVLNGPEEYQLVDVSSAAMRSDGSVVVVDRGARTVRLYDAEGEFLALLGGPGTGPGEFLDPGPVLVTEGDSILVWDQPVYRVTRFGPGGDLAGVETVDLAAVATFVEPPTYPGEMEPLLDGNLLVRLVEKAPISKGEKSGGFVFRYPESSFRRPSGALRVSRDLSRVDTLMFFGDVEQVTAEAPWGPWAVTPAAPRQTSITHSGDPPRICIGDSETPEVSCFGPKGKRRIFRWTSDPRPVTEEEVLRWREANVRSLGEKMDENQVREILTQAPVRTERPPYSGILIDRVGNLWVEVGPSKRRDPRLHDHLVFDEGGALLGTVSLPSFRVMEIGADHVVGVLLDELEVQHLQIFRLLK
jgi:hypothetical protein